MKNPLRKRLLRELKNDIGKYLVIFLFMTATIGFVSGFLVADESMLYAYDESFEKYNVENGNFTTEQKLTDNQRTRLEKEKVTIYENFYKDEDADTDLDSEPESTIRLFKNRTEVNLVCLMKGEMPQQKDEIAIDRMYADNNDLQVGDVISVDKKELTVTGLVALSDYSALFSNSSDMMFDAVKFGVGIMTEEGYDAITDDHIKYCYSWKYDTEPKDENEEKEWSDDFVEVLAAHSSLTGYLPRYGNQAIKFTGDDMGGDKVMVEVLLYILIAIMAFIFAVTTNNTIVKEASVIGTLRASGYTRRELLLHYLSLPVLITILSAVIGNILGYTVFKDICAGMYYGSYSLPTYQTRWNANAFLLNSDVCDQRGADFRPSASVTAAFSAPRFCKERKKPCGASSELPVLLAVSSADPAAEQIELLYPVSRYRICQYSVAVRYDDETAAVTLPDGGGGKYAGRLPVYFKCPGSDR